MNISKRSFLLGSVAAVFASPSTAKDKAGLPIHVFKGKGCACCVVWTDLLEAENFLVTSEELHPADLIQLKLQKGIPQNLVSCHTAEIDGFIVEGHVPVADIRRLISERPTAIGIAVAGMPYGSPGMGPEEEREAYDVILINVDGTTEVFTSYEAAV